MDHYEARLHQSYYGHTRKVSHTEEELAESRRPRSRRPSLKKAISMFTESNGRNSFQNAPSMPTSPTTVTHRKSFGRKPSIDQYPAPRKSAGQRTSVETFQQHRRNRPSQYYQDPEARMKLKLYLACPQNFEEALAYGFPTTASEESSPDTPHHSKQNSASTRLSSRDLHRFLNNNTLSFLDTSDDGCASGSWEEQFRAMHIGEDRVGEDRDGDDKDEDDDEDEDDNISLSEMDTPLSPSSPLTPAVPEYYRPPYLSHHTDFSLMAYGRQRHNSNGPIWDGNREMTLRMTLTKPELRSPEADIYGAGNGYLDPDDPLALEPLSSMEERAYLDYMSSPPDGCKVRNWWRKMKGTSMSRR